MDTHKMEVLSEWMAEELTDRLKADFTALKEMYMLEFGHGAYWFLDRLYDDYESESKSNKGEL